MGHKWGQLLDQAKILTNRISHLPRQWGSRPSYRIGCCEKRGSDGRRLPKAAGSQGLAAQKSGPDHGVNAVEPRAAFTCLLNKDARIITRYPVAE